jgi:TolB-like protein/Flp pilus assembly protein TadD
VTDLRERLQNGLADRYQLDRELGRGGMATVFLAQDLRHKRFVALKVLHPELAQTLGPERFQREIETVARLQHPHILTVHDSGETAGQLWFTMPFVEGESLRDRLRRETQLPVEDALRIATDAAQALQYAHEHGVIHRDIKPENLLLTKDGSTLVADFGIARALSGSGDRLTQTGLSLGTPTYMSPEQAAGDQHLDARTDVYSLGTVLYEMLAGEPPFTGTTAQTVIAKRFSGEVPRVRHVRPSVPESVEQAVIRALAPVAADRFASAAEFARAVQPSTVTPTAAPTRRLAAANGRARRLMPVAAMALVLGVLIGLGVLFAWRRSHPGGDDGGPGAKKRVAVLPFENLGQPNDEYFADGMTDAVRGKLVMIPGLAVIARTSSSLYKQTTKPPQQIARELGVQYLLSGTVRWDMGTGRGASTRVQVNPELVQASGGSAPVTRWQQPFDAVLSDVFQVQSDIAGRVAHALGVALEAGERQSLIEPPTRSLGAYDAYLQGKELLERGASDQPTLRGAVTYFEQAVALDSTFALAWASLSLANTSFYANGNSTPEVAERARVAAEKAVALAPDRPEARRARGRYYQSLRQDYARALEDYTEALRSAPDDAETIGVTASLEEDQGHWEPALAHRRAAATLDPRSGNAAHRLAYTLLWLRRYPEASAASRRALALAPFNLDVVMTRVMVHLAQGELAGARAVLRQVSGTIEPTALVAFFATYNALFWVLDADQQQLLLRLTPSTFADNRAFWGMALAQTYALRGESSKARVYADSARSAIEALLQGAPEDALIRMNLGLSLAYLGRRDEAVREGNRGVALAPNLYRAHCQHQLARIYTLVGEPEQALGYLEELLRVPYWLSPNWLKIDPTFDPLRGNPRFERLVKGK